MISAQARQTGTQLVEVTWTTDQPAPAAGFDVTVDIDAAGPVGLGTASGTADRWLDGSLLWTPGQSLVYEVTDKDTLQSAVTAAVVVADLDQPPTFGPVDPLADTIRYTTLDIVKLRLGISHTEYDAALTTAIIGAEIAIDQWNGRSLPDTGENPELAGIPQAIREWALDAAIAIWKAADAPFGTGGSDAWLGGLDIQNITERTIRRHPLSLGFKVTWGVA